MNRRKQGTLWDDLRDALDEVISIATTLNEQTENGTVRTALSVIIKDAEAGKKRTSRCEELLDFRGYKFAIIDPTTGEIRPATYDEGMRIIMDYPPAEFGGITQIMQRYKNFTTAHNGQEPDASNWQWLNDPSSKTDAEKEGR